MVGVLTFAGTTVVAAATDGVPEAVASGRSQPLALRQSGAPAGNTRAVDSVAWPSALTVGEEDGYQRLVSGSIEVLFRPSDRPMAERTLRAASTPLRLPGIAVSAPPPAARILLAGDPAAFDSLTGGAPHWSAGIAIPARRVIVLPAYSSARTPMGDPLVALRHELVHLALNAHIGGRVPRWFDEGYATWASGEWDAGRGWEIRLALLGGGTPPLDSLRLGWPGRQADARLAYLLSASAVSHLASIGGEDSFRAFIDVWRREGDFDAALRGVYGLTLSGFEAEWRAMVKTRYGWLLALSQMGVVWALVAALLVLVTLPRRRRNREKLQRMRVEEWVEEWADEVEVGEPVEPRSSSS